MRRSSRSAPRHAIDISEADGVRYLHFGSEWVQGAMRVARPWSLELDYTREMMAGLLLRSTDAWPKNALLIGLGAGSLAKFIYRNLPDCRITVVEINPQIEFVARQYFRLPDDARLEIVTGCGADYLLACRRSFDAIFVDGFDPEGHAGVLDTSPFYQACRACLSDTGLLSINLLREKGYAQRVDRITTAFDGRLIVLPPCDSGNTIALANAGQAISLSFEQLSERARALKTATRLDLQPTLKRWQKAQTSAETGVEL